MIVSSWSSMLRAAAKWNDVTQQGGESIGAKISITWKYSIIFWSTRNACIPWHTVQQLSSHAEDKPFEKLYTFCLALPWSYYLPISSFGSIYSTTFSESTLQSDPQTEQLFKESCYSRDIPTSFSPGLMCCKNMYTLGYYKIIFHIVRRWLLFEGQLSRHVS